MASSSGATHVGALLAAVMSGALRLRCMLVCSERLRSLSGAVSSLGLPGVEVVAVPASAWAVAGGHLRALEAAFATARGAAGAAAPAPCLVIVVIDSLDAVCGARGDGAGPAARLVARFGRGVLAAGPGPEAPAGSPPRLMLLASVAGASVACLHEGVRTLWQHTVLERDFMVRRRWWGRRSNHHNHESSDDDARCLLLLPLRWGCRLLER
jgi:hypothetical protein